MITALLVLTFIVFAPYYAGLAMDRFLFNKNRVKNEDRFDYFITWVVGWAVLFIIGVVLLVLRAAISAPHAT